MRRLDAKLVQALLIGYTLVAFVCVVGFVIATWVR